MSLGAGGIAAPPYMPTTYPQYNQQHLNQYTSNNAYMQSAAGYWSASNAAPNGKVPQYPNQSPEKK
jgi:hypothetical protein